jgi:hypothetical protein
MQMSAYRTDFARDRSCTEKAPPKSKGAFQTRSAELRLVEESRKTSNLEGEQEVLTTKKAPRRGVRGLSMFLLGEIPGGTDLADLIRRNAIEGQSSQLRERRLIVTREKLLMETSVPVVTMSAFRW